MRMSLRELAPRSMQTATRGGFGRVAAGVVIACFAGAILSCGGGDGPSGPGDTSKGALAVSANVAGAAIFLNGVDTGKTTDATLSDLDAGSYTV